MNYKLLNSGAVIRLNDFAVISANPDNMDYLEYLRWVEAGNTPELEN